MKDINVGNDLNKMSMATEEKDDDDMFFDSLAEGLKIAAALAMVKKTEKSQHISELIPASNHFMPLSNESILR